MQIHQVIYTSYEKNMKFLQMHNSISISPLPEIKIKKLSFLNYWEEKYWKLSYLQIANYFIS